MWPESGLIKPKRQFENSALARAGYAENGFGFAMREPERNVVQHDLVVKCEGHILEPDGLAA